MTGQSVLLVEDEPISAKVIKETLQQAGYLVTACENGKQAVDLLKGGQVAIDLILLDHMMPEMDGIDFLRWRESEGCMLSVPVVMLTAVSDSDAIVSALEAGAQEYLTKPVDPEQLLTLVQTLVS